MAHFFLVPKIEDGHLVSLQYDLSACVLSKLLLHLAMALGIEQGCPYFHYLDQRCIYRHQLLQGYMLQLFQEREVVILIRKQQLLMYLLYLKKALCQKEYFLNQYLKFCLELYELSLIHI